MSKIYGNPLTTPINPEKFSGGASAEEWQLLCDTTTTEDIITFGIDKDMNGNPFSCRKIYAQVRLPQVMSLQIQFGHELENGYGRLRAGMNINKDSKFCDLKMELVKDKFALLSISQKIQDYFSSQLPHDTFINTNYILGLTGFNKFYIANGLVENPFPVGTRILVWGCKA